MLEGRLEHPTLLLTAIKNQNPFFNPSTKTNLQQLSVVGEPPVHSRANSPKFITKRLRTKSLSSPKALFKCRRLFLTYSATSQTRGAHALGTSTRARMTGGYEPATEQELERLSPTRLKPRGPEHRSERVTP